MREAIDQFRANLVRVRSLDHIAGALDSQTTQALDLSDILRSELVLAVSALDQFVHEVTRLGMLEAYNGERTRTASFLSFQVPLSGVLEAVTDNRSDMWLDEQIRIRNGYRSFQSPDHIADAIRLVSDISLWNEVGARLGASSSEVREKLNSIVVRRNQIAHEADINPSPYEDLWPIDKQTVSESVDFIERIAEAIYAAISQS